LSGWAILARRRRLGSGRYGGEGHQPPAAAELGRAFTAGFQQGPTDWLHGTGLGMSAEAELVPIPAAGNADRNRTNSPSDTDVTRRSTRDTRAFISASLRMRARDEIRNPATERQDTSHSSTRRATGARAAVSGLVRRVLVGGCRSNALGRERGSARHARAHAPIVFRTNPVRGLDTLKLEGLPRIWPLGSACHRTM